jgi:hypothetical protein
MKHIILGLLLSLMIGLQGCTILRNDAEDQVEVDQKKNCGKAMTQRTKCD